MENLSDLTTRNLFNRTVKELSAFVDIKKVIIIYPDPTIFNEKNKSTEERTFSKAFTIKDFFDAKSLNYIQDLLQNYDWVLHINDAVLVIQHQSIKL